MAMTTPRRGDNEETRSTTQSDTTTNADENQNWTADEGEEVTYTTDSALAGVPVEDEQATGNQTQPGTQQTTRSEVM